MSDFLGVDTSNYTTSVAVFNCEERSITQEKRLLPVREGELGLRQSDAVFHHTKQIPEMVEKLAEKYGGLSLEAVAASVRPRNTEGSYMPCFLCGEGLGRSLSAVNKLSFYTTSHQVGHILAALYSAGKMSYVNERFIAFHVSGGTTDCLLCEPDDDLIIKVTEIGTSLDLKAGQAVDRCGLMLGLRFPCGAELEKLAERSDQKVKIRPVIKDGNCCLSGVENKCRQMTERGASPEDTARFCLDFIGETIIAMTLAAKGKCGDLPLVFAGGVMSDSIIRRSVTERFTGASFAAPEFSCDNAAGVAIYGWLKQTGVKKCL
ncbi:MAG: peptidase M22 [Ruminococcus sp.]|nr:peptidase M22 [Ruminococcus sp.]